MIAPIDRPLLKAGRKTQALHSARRVAASALLDTEGRSNEAGKPVARWQVWLFVSWAVVTSAAYFAYMLGLIH
jgi:hypothetical protein